MSEETTEQNENEPLFACCDGFNNRIPTHGDGIDRGSVNGVTVQFFEDGGHLCFHDLIIDGISNPFGVTVDIDGTTVYGKVKATKNSQTQKSFILLKWKFLQRKT